MKLIVILLYFARNLLYSNHFRITSIINVLSEISAEKNRVTTAFKNRIAALFGFRIIILPIESQFPCRRYGRLNK